MAEIKQSNGRLTVNYMARDYDSLLRSMRDMIPYKLPEWEDFESEADFGNVLLQLFAHMGDILSYYQDRVANESFLATAQTRRSVIHHLRLIGYQLSTAAPASTNLKMTATVRADLKEIVIRKGDAFATKSQRDTPSTRFEYTGGEDLRIKCTNFPEVDGKREIKATIPVEEGRLIQDEILGLSDGTPNQRFPLAHPRLILRSLGQGQEIHKDIIVKTKQSEEPPAVEWTLQETLAFSQDNQRDFVMEIDEDDRATVVFGDGKFGAKPAKGTTITATYRVGGGPHGNVRADTIRTIVNAPQLTLLAATVTNPKPATGGSERESIEHAVLHAPKVFRSLKRAVTARDYEALALEYKGVGKVRAEATNWNTVTLYVAPEGGGQVSDVLRSNLLAHFEDKRPLSTIIEVEDVDYVKVYVAAEVGVESYYDRKDIAEKVGQAATNLLAPENVSFGQTIYLSKFYEAIEAIPGVANVNIVEFRRAGQAAGEVDPSGKLDLKVHEIPRIPDVGERYASGIDIVKLEGGVG